MEQKEFNSLMSMTIDKIRERLYEVENSLSSATAEMLNVSKNLDELIDIHKKQSEELSSLKSSYNNLENSFKNIYKINIKDFFNPNVIFGIVFVVYILERSGVWKICEHWFGIN